MPQPNNNKLSRNEIRAREQRKIRWNGKNKHGSYQAYDEAIRNRKFERDQQRAAKKRAEENGEFIPVNSGRVSKNLKNNIKIDYSVRGGAFSALYSDDEDNNETPVAPVTPAPAVASAAAPAAPIKNKRSYEEAIMPSLDTTNKKQEPKRKLTWFEMCESDDE